MTDNTEGIWQLMCLPGYAEMAQNRLDGPLTAQPIQPLAFGLKLNPERI